MRELSHFIKLISLLLAIDDGKAGLNAT